MLKSFWHWYNKHLFLNTSIAAGLFTIQLVHLYWLTTDVVFFKLTGHQYFPVNIFWQNILVLVDYTEIPAIITTSLVYINEYLKTKKLKNLLYLFFLDIQLLHIFWITDEFVLDQFTGDRASILPGWLAWVAIMIDYLELPVIYDTFKKLLNARNLKGIKHALKED